MLCNYITILVFAKPPSIWYFSALVVSMIHHGIFSAVQSNEWLWPGTIHCRSLNLLVRQAVLPTIHLDSVNCLGGGGGTAMAMDILILIDAHQLDATSETTVKSTSVGVILVIPLKVSCI